MLMTLTRRCVQRWQTADKISAKQLPRIRLASPKARFLLQTFLSHFWSASAHFFLELHSAHVQYQPLSNLQANLGQGLHTVAKLSSVGRAGASLQVASINTLGRGKIKPRVNDTYCPLLFLTCCCTLTTQEPRKDKSTKCMRIFFTHLSNSSHLKHGESQVEIQIGHSRWDPPAPTVDGDQILHCWDSWAEEQGGEKKTKNKIH